MKVGTCKYTRTVNYYETDNMGIVHHSNYVRFFEEARIDWMSKMDLDYKKIEDMGLIIPVTFVECNYLKPLCFGDEFSVYTTLVKYSGIKMEVAYEIYNTNSGELCTKGKTGHCFLNSDLQPVNMKKKYKEIYDKLVSLVEL